MIEFAQNITVPVLTIDNLGGELYRGNTMNSFNTLMGRSNEECTNSWGVKNIPMILNCKYGEKVP